MLIIQIYNDNNKAGNRGTRVRGLITDPQAQTISQPSKNIHKNYPQFYILKCLLLHILK